MLEEAVTDPWQIQIHRVDERSLPAEIEVAWDRLAADNKQSTIFQDRGFVELWSNHKSRASGGRLLVCYAKSSDEPVEIVLPMVQVPGAARSLWIRRFYAAGEPNFDFQDPLVSSLERFCERRDAFWNGFTKALMTIGCSRFTITRTHREFLPDQCERDASEQTWKSSLGGFESLDHFLSARSSNLRGDVNRRMRKMSAEGSMAYEIFSPDQIGEANAELAVMQRSYEKLWEGQPASSLFHMPGLLAWYRALIAHYLPKGTLHFSRLICGGEPVAWHFGFLHHGVLHWYKPTYRKEYAHLSPGKVLLAKVIEEGIRRGWGAVDYGPGMEPYKQQWGNETSEMCRWEWNSVAGVSGIVDLIRRRWSTSKIAPQ